MCFVGVGNNPDSVPLVRRSKGGSGDTKPLRIIPDLGQGPEKFTEPFSRAFLWSREKPGDVLKNDIGRANILGEPDNMAKQSAASFRANSSLRSRAADILTGETSADDINGNSIGSKSVCGECSDIFITWDLRPVFS